jgi:hypothetical protein
MDFYKQFLRESPNTEGDRKVHLAIFGKHPGWDDHIPDIALTSETLILLKRHFYVRGIGGIIDSGFWDGLVEKGQIQTFDHQFFGQVGSEGIVGRLWASSDGKGRTRYPMIVVAHISGLPVDRCLDPLLEELETFHQSCRDLSTAEEVLALLEATQKKLERSLASLPLSGDPLIAGRRLLGRMLRKDPLLDTSKHQRLLYEIHNLLGAFAPGKAEKALADSATSGEHMRLPNPELASRGESFLAWTTYFRTQVSAQCPLLFLCPAEGSWMDCIVGDFSGSLLRCLRSNLEHSPCVTEIEYNIPGEFSDRVQPLISRMADWDRAPNENSVFAAPAKARISPKSEDRPLGKKRADPPPARERTPEPLKKPQAKQRKAIAIAGIAIAVVFVMALLLFSGNDEPLPGGSSEPEEVLEIPEQAMAAITYLDKAAEWYPRFLKFARTGTVHSAWLEDEDLKSLAGQANDPALYELLDTVGSVTGMQKEAYAVLPSATKDAIPVLEGRIRTIEQGILDWLVWDEVRALQERARRSGWESVSGALERYAAPAEIVSGIGPRMQEILQADVDLRLLFDLQQANDQLVGDLQFLAEEGLFSVAEINARELAGAADLSAYKMRLERANTQLRSLATAMGGGVGNVRLDLLKEDPRHDQLAAAAGNELSLVQDLLADYRLLSQGELPSGDLSRILPRGELEGTIGQISRLLPEVDSGQFLRRWDALNRRMAEVMTLAPVAINRERITSEASSVLKDLEELRDELDQLQAESSDLGGWYEGLSTKLGPESLLEGQWRSHVKTIVPQEDLPALSADTAAYSERRQSVDVWAAIFRNAERTLSDLSLPPLPAGAIAADLERRADLEAWLKDRLIDSLQQLLDGLSERQAPQMEWEEAVKNWARGTAAQLINVLSLFEKDIAAFAADLQEVAPVGISPGKVLIIANRFWSDDDLPDRLGGVIARARELEAVRGATSIGDLLPIFEGTPQPAIRYEICKRLEALPDWPATVADLQLAMGLWQRIQPGEALPSGFEESVFALWQTAVRSADNRSGRIPFWQFFDEFMPDRAESLSPVWQYDRAVSLLLSPAFREDDSQSAPEVRSSLVRFLRSSEELTAEPSIGAFTETLAALDLSGESRGDAADSLAAFGPALHGWELHASDPEGAWVHYRWRSVNLSLRTGMEFYDLVFLLIDDTTEEPFYLATHEVPSGLFFDWLNDTTGWDRLDPIFPSRAIGADDQFRDDNWSEGRGARSWTLDAGKNLYLHDTWQYTSAYNEVPVDPEAFTNPPNRFSPLNFISREVASTWADGLACRLPTPAEFRAVAEKVSKRTLPIAGVNLRDQAWRKQMDYLRAEPGAEGLFGWPHLNCFVPEGVQAKGLEAAAATEIDDGEVWFYDVTFPGDDPLVLKNLRGNVAEYLFDPTSGQSFVAGGSAFSPPEVEWDRPYALTGTEPAIFSDIGFRLAMDAPRISPKQRLTQAARSAPDLFLP